MTTFGLTVGSIVLGVDASDEIRDELAASYEIGPWTGSSVDRVIRPDPDFGAPLLQCRNGDDGVVFAGRWSDEFLAAFDEDLLSLIVERTGDLAVHGGGFVIGDRAVVVLGPSYRGKSTFVAEQVLARGRGYLSDELIGLCDGTAWGFPRPLHLRDDAARRWAGTVGQRPTARVAVPDRRGTTAVGWVVMLERHDDPVGPVALAPLSSAGIARHLLASAFNIREVDRAVVLQACEVAQGAVGFVAHYREATELAALLDDQVHHDHLGPAVESVQVTDTSDGLVLASFTGPSASTLVVDTATDRMASVHGVLSQIVSRHDLPADIKAAFTDGN